MPFPNESSCRLRQPNGGKTRRQNGARTHEGKKYDVIYQEKKDGAWEDQAFRYPKETWTAAEAKAHCKAHDGIEFEPPSERAGMEGGMNKILVRLKGAQGWDHDLREMTLDDVVAWFRGCTDKDGNVQADIVLYGDALFKAADKGDEFDWTMSDFTLDRDKEQIDPEGWDLKEFKQNPVLLWSHDWMRPAIGQVKHPKVVDGRLKGQVSFDSAEVDPFAAMIAAKVRRGTIRAGSVGFIPMKVEIPTEDDEKDGKARKPKDMPKLIYRKQKLYEFSACNVPSNPAALVNEQKAEVTWSVHGDGTKQRKGDVVADELLPEEVVVPAVEEKEPPWFKSALGVFVGEVTRRLDAVENVIKGIEARVGVADLPRSRNLYDDLLKGGRSQTRWDPKNPFGDVAAKVGEKKLNGGSI
jgi:HK97 family phage prohead protease